MPKAPYFFFGGLECVCVNLIALIISRETKASLLALAKSIYYLQTSPFKCLEKNWKVYLTLV